MDFCRKISYVAISAFFGGHFWPTFNGRWHKNFLKDWAHTFQDWANFHELYLNIRVYWNKIQASECLPSWSRPWPPPSPSSSPRGQPAQLWSNSGPPPHHIWKKSVKQNYRNTVQMSLIWEGQILTCVTDSKFKRRPSDKAGSGIHGAPGGQQVVHDEHPCPSADSALLHLACDIS